MSLTVNNKDQKFSVELDSSNLESYFQQFRKNIVGIGQTFQSPYGTKEIIYADWTASGRLYRPIEDKLLNDIGPYLANTHTETSLTGSSMTMAYHEARNIIKKHVNANNDDVLLTTGTGMTGAINKFQRILGLKISENLRDYTKVPDKQIFCIVVWRNWYSGCFIGLIDGIGIQFVLLL